MRAMFVNSYKESDEKLLVNKSAIEIRICYAAARLIIASNKTNADDPELTEIGNT